MHSKGAYLVTVYFLCVVSCYSFVAVFPLFSLLEKRLGR